ncbi:XkdX family protein [Bacillus velezensis]|nr:XkdX family protein [Bacillus velezensis]
MNKSNSYKYFDRCWGKGTVTTKQMNLAVSVGWITQAEYDEITAKQREFL